MGMKEVCQLDSDGYLIGFSLADESPLEPGQWLMPEGSIGAPPPEDIPPGYRARWGAEGWTFELLPEPPAPPQPTPEEIRRDAIMAIDRQREEQLIAGVEMTGSRYHSDDRFLTELLGMLMGYQVGIYNGTQDIRTRDNTIVALGVEQITALAAAVGAYRKAVYAASWAAKDAL